MNRLQSHENGPNSPPQFYVNSPAIHIKFAKIGSHFHEISLRFLNFLTGSKGLGKNKSSILLAFLSVFFVSTQGTYFNMRPKPRREYE